MENYFTLKSTKYSIIGLFLLFGVYFLLAPNTGTDYLYYYRPIAEYFFHNHSFPESLSVTDIDATFAYPPFESILLSAAMFLQPFDGLAIKAIHIGKLAMLFWLLFKIVSCYKLDGYRFLGFLLCQPMIYFSGIYNTDLNVLAAVASVILVFKNRKWLPLATVLVAIALLSKYPFLVLYALILLIFCFKKKHRELFWMLTPVLIYSLFLFKNFYCYGNPFYPIFENALGRNEVSSDIFINYFAWYQSKQNILRNVLQGIITSISLMFIPLLGGTKERLLWMTCGCYFLVWGLLMNVDSAGQTSRFLMPATLLLFMVFASPSTSDRNREMMVYGIIFASSLMTVFMDKAIFVTSIPILIWSVLGIVQLKIKITKLAAIHSIVIVSIILVASIRLIHKGSISINGNGYQYYQKEIKLLDKLSDEGQVLTDFKLIPYDLRIKPTVDLDGSSVFGNWRCIGQNYACKQYDFLFTQDSHSNILRQRDNGKNYEQIPIDINGYRLFRRKPGLIEG